MTAIRTITLALLIALAGGCGASNETAAVPVSDQTTVVGDDGETEPTLTEGETEPSASEEADAALDSYDPDVLAEARSEFDNARARWDAAGISDYELVISFPGFGEQRTMVIDGASTSRETTFAPDFTLALPVSVDEIFAEADRLIGAAEDDPLVDFSACTGHFFSVSYDEELGYPRHWNSFSPCDDGVSANAEVIVG